MDRSSNFRIYIFSILAAIFVAIALIILILNPPMNDLVFLGTLLAITSAGSAVIGYLSHYFGWWHRFRSLTISLTMGYVLAALLTFLNIWVTARMMFISEDDLFLGSVLLVFAGVISVGFGYFLANSITLTIKKLVRGAEELSQGQFDTRVLVQGNDEIADLGRAFNKMASRLQEAKEKEEDLEQMRRDLVAGASHDLRTPLASLRAMMEAMSDGVVDDQETIERYLEQSQAEVARMTVMIDDLFELAQMDAGNQKLDLMTASIKDLISDTLGSFAIRAEVKKIDLTGTVSEDVDLVWMAPDQIGRVLNNLVENALRYTEENEKVEITAKINGDRVLVNVIDSGPGISAENIPLIFDRFYRVEKSRSREGFESGGTGLGLTIAKGIIEAHGGDIWVESELGQGATFWFSLPRSKQ